MTIDIKRPLRNTSHKKSTPKTETSSFKPVESHDFAAPFNTFADSPEILSGIDRPIATQVHTLQRVYGNRQLSRMLEPDTSTFKPSPAPQAIVQRMPTGNELIEVAGAPKEDRNLLFTKKKMSTLYKAVIGALDTYSVSLTNAGLVSPFPGIRTSSVETLTGHLDNVTTAAQKYLTAHSDDTRSSHIQMIVYQVNEEKALLQKIASSNSYNGQKWADVVNQLQPTNRLQKDINDGTLNQNLFHGTSSNLLGNFGGELMTGRELERRGIVPESGEGDFYSSGGGGGAKGVISSGIGAPGMGTALAYAQSVGQFEDYNPALYDDRDLQHEIDMLNNIIANWRDELNQVPNDDIMGARRTKPQFEGLKAKLVRESELRATLPKNHPRHKGQPFDGSTYPLLFEFKPDGLTINNPRPDISQRMDTDSPRQLGGERNITDSSVDMRIPGTLVRVYCPAENMEAVRTRMTAIVGHSSFDVVGMELIGVSEVTEFTRIATMEMMQTLYANTRRLVLHAYERGMTQDTNVDKASLAETGQFIEILKTMSKGNLKDEQIGRETGIALENIPDVMRRLFAFLGVKNRKQAVKVGKERGMVPNKF